MKYPNMLFLALLIPLHTLRLQTALPISPHETQEILATEVRRFDSDKTRMPEQLAELARAYHIPMGIEAIYRLDEQLTPLHSKGGTVKDAIDLIVRQAPGYSWQVTNDVLHVYPTSLMTDPRDFLNIGISRFELTKTSLLAASAELR